jgi:hypothetical protein
MSMDPWHTGTSESRYFAFAHRDNICPEAQLVKMQDEGLRWHALQSEMHLLHRMRFA